jgi:hypothetical protein
MNCLLETVAGAYLHVRSRFAPRINGEDLLGDAEDNLEACRASLVARELDVEHQCESLARAALAKKRLGDIPGARFAIQVPSFFFEATHTHPFPQPLTPSPFPQERRRAIARLDKLRNGVALIDRQLDALRNSELDKELMNSLRVSNQAMKKAGLGDGVEEAETVMNELDNQIREASELTSVLATPLADLSAGGAGVTGLDDELARELDLELGLLETTEPPRPTATPPTPVAALPLPPPPAPAPVPAIAPHQVSSMMDW